MLVSQTAKASILLSKTVSQHLCSIHALQSTAAGCAAGNVRDTSCSLKGSQAQSSLLCAGAVLGWHFREHGVSAEALRGFNAERGPRVKEVYTKV